MKKWLLLIMVIILGIPLTSLTAPQSQAASRDTHVYFEGERLIFDDAEPVLMDGRTLVPFRKIFETLGFEVEWIEGARQAVGKKEGLQIELPIDSHTAKVNGQSIELDVPAQVYQSRTLVPLRFVSENSGYHVYFAVHDNVAVVGIGRTVESSIPSVIEPTNPVPDPEPTPEPSPEPDPESPEPYVVKGKVVNELGQPLAGVMVYADNTFLYDSWIEGITDQQGNYVLHLPNVAASYRMGAKYEIEYNEETLPFEFDPVDNAAFGSNEGAVRDFVLDINKGTIQIFDYDFYHDENAPDVELSDVEFTLKSIGSLVDGSKDRTIVASPDKRGYTVENVPIGTYELSAVWKPKGYKEVPMLVRVRFSEDFKEKEIISFENTFSDVYVSPIELSFD